MTFSKEEIEAQIEQLKKQRDGLVANLHGIDGALAVLNGMIQEKEESDAQE